PGNAIQAWAKIVSVAPLRGSAVDRHSNANVAVFRPRLGLERFLDIDRCKGAVRWGMERCAERITNGLEDKAVVAINDLAQQGIVALQGGRHRLRLLFPQARAAFDVGEEERYVSGWRAHAPAFKTDYCDACLPVEPAMSSMWVVIFATRFLCCSLPSV